MKTIFIKPKYAQAGTQYYEYPNQEDKEYIYNFLAQEMAAIGEDFFKNPNIVATHTELFNKRKRMYGNQTGWEFLCGGINQHVNNPKKDISDKQIEGIETLMQYFGRPVKLTIQAYTLTKTQSMKPKNTFHNNFVIEDA